MLGALGNHYSTVSILNSYFYLDSVTSPFTLCAVKHYMSHKCVLMS